MQPPPQIFGAPTMITRGLKLFAGIGAVGFGMWAMAGSFASSDGAPAVVSGQTAIIRAVQDGYTSLDGLRRGSAVHKGDAIGTLLLSPTGENNSNKSMTLVQTRGRVDAIEAEVATLQDQIRDLQERTKKNRVARIDDLNSKLEQANTNLEAARAKEAAANAILERQQKVFSIGWTVKSTVEAAKSTADAAKLDRNAAEKQIATLQVELSAARDGTFLQDAYNDAAYSQQRADQLKLRVADLQAEAQQQNHLLKLLEGDVRQLNASGRDAASDFSVPILSPASGIVWSVINGGQYVRAGDEIARVIDCSELSANATVSAREYAAIKDGDRAVFRQQDQKRPWKGTVAWAGVPASNESAASIPATIAPGLNNLQYSVIVSLDDMSNATNCPAGKFGRVVFENTRASPTLDRLTAMMVDTLHLR
jgi:multidrug efflux pump subunit AcrA (membrane-fusion protein)